MNKFKWTLLLAALISLLCLLYLPSNEKPKYTNDLKLSSVNLSQGTSLKIPLDNKSDKHKLNNETVAVGYSCNRYESTLRNIKKNKHQFIQDKALLWYLEGEDKNKILKTLSALYGFNMANKWRNRVNKISIYHQEVEALKAYLNATDYNLFYKSHQKINPIENKISWVFYSQFDRSS